MFYRSLITAGLFEEAASQQGLLPTGEAVWKEVRGRMAAATGARKALVDECPASCIGALLTMLLQQVSRLPTHLAALLLRRTIVQGLHFVTDSGCQLVMIYTSYP